MSTRRPRFAQPIVATLLALAVSLSVACTGESAPPDPTATKATTQPPTATQPSQPTQPQTLSPTRRTPVQTLSPRQIQATQRAQLATIEAEILPPTPQVIYPTAPRPFQTSAPSPTLAPLAHVCARTLAIPHHGAATYSQATANVRPVVYAYTGAAAHAFAFAHI